MKNSQRPITHYMKAVYADYALRLLKENPTWWGKYEKRLKVKNCYIYAKEKDKVVLKMSWPVWKDAITRYFHGAKEAIIQGQTLRMGTLGKIRAIRVQRDFSNPVVNWGETFKQNLKDEQGKLIHIYYTDDDYCRIEWEKFGMIPNESSYRFRPAAKNMNTGKGFKREFIDALNADPMLKFKYKYFPLRKKAPCNTDTVPSETSSDE